MVTSEGGSFLANTTFNKGHVLIIKWKKTLKTNVKWGLCTMIHEGTKFRWTITQSDSVLTYMFGKVKLIKQKMFEINIFQNKV